MSEKDVSTINYFEDSERFSDLLNGHIFHGKQVLRPEQIREISPRGSVKTSAGTTDDKSIVVTRDVVYEVDTCANPEIHTTIIALESQSDIHYAMPVRVITGDSANYNKQWKKIAKRHRKAQDVKNAEYLSGFSKNDRLIPASTIVIYFGQEPWDGPRSLKDMLDLDGLPPEIQELIADYPMHLIEVRNYPNYESFQTDLKYVFGFLQHAQDKSELISYINENTEAFSNLAEDTYNIITRYSRSKELEKVWEGSTVTTEGGVNMCKAITDLIADGEQRGMKRGMEQGLIQGIIQMCKEFGATRETTLGKIMKETSLSEDQANEYLVQLWK